MILDELRHREKRSFPTPSIEYEYIWMKQDLFFAVLTLDGIEILFCFCCLAAIILGFRKHLIFASTGYWLIYLFMLGCVMILLSVPLFGIDSKITPALSIPNICMTRIWLLNVGFTFSVGILIVRVIYTIYIEINNDIKNSVISPLTLVFFVGCFAIIDTIVVIAWRLFSPPHKEYEKKKVEQIGLRDERVTLVETCNSEKESLLITFFCFYKGVLLLVAFLLSVFVKKEEKTRNEDFKQCPIGLLSALATGFVVIPVVLSLPLSPNISFAIGGLLILLETAFLMFWIICTKIIKAYKCKKGEAVEFGKYSVEGTIRCVPCIRPMYGCIYNENKVGFSNEGFVESMLDVQEPDPEEFEESFENKVPIGVGFDSKESEDVLPDDIPAFDEIEMKPYVPKSEEEEVEEEEGEEGEEESVILDGESSDEDQSSSDSDAEQNENATSQTTIEKSAVSVYVAKSTDGKRDETDDGDPDQNRENSADSRRKSWWKPLFGIGTKTKKNSEQSSEMTTESRRFSTSSSRTGTSYDVSSTDDDSSSESSDGEYDGEYDGKYDGQ